MDQFMEAGTRRPGSMMLPLLGCPHPSQDTGAEWPFAELSGAPPLTAERSLRSRVGNMGAGFKANPSRRLCIHTPLLPRRVLPTKGAQVWSGVQHVGKPRERAAATTVVPAAASTTRDWAEVQPVWSRARAPQQRATGRADSHALPSRLAQQVRTAQRLPSDNTLDERSSSQSL